MMSEARLQIVNDAVAWAHLHGLVRHSHGNRDEKICEIFNLHLTGCVCDWLGRGHAARLEWAWR
jgi:hypothetical protein